jgi:UDPglucose--hexose-1-phosphate uridylyltransferase
MQRYDVTGENVEEILHREIGLVFAHVLEDAGVYKLNEQGRAGFVRFLESVK